MLRASVVIDYQNVHMTAHDVFDPRGDLHDALIHPVLFARAAIARRNSIQREGMPHAQASRVLVFRGLPHVDHDWEQHRRCQQQATQWRADGAIVQLRDLKYTYQRGADGRPQAKGIDVLCAIACVREASRDDVDLVVLASRDTDLVPALDEVHDMHTADPARNARIETLTWDNLKWQEEHTRRTGSIRPTAPRRIWNTNLDRACYNASRDTHHYQ